MHDSYRGQLARKKLLAAFLVLLMGILVSACGSSGVEGEQTVPDTTGSEETVPDETTEGGADLTPVVIETQPYYDYKFFDVAAELGIDEEFGLDLEIITVPDQFSYRRVIRGDVDIAASCPTCILPVLEAAPELRHFMVNQLFKGFVPIGRVGADGEPERKTYDQFLEEEGGDVDAAIKAFAESLGGSSWAITPEIQGSNMRIMLEKGGLTLDDVEIIPFPDETKSALGFINGEGDYYFGSLPQSIRLVSSPELEGQFVVAGTHLLFPTAYGNFVATEEWLAANEETALRLWATWFRATRYLKEQPERVLELIAELLQPATGGILTPEETEAALVEFNEFPLLDEAAAYFDPDSLTYFGSNEEVYSSAASAGQFPESITWDQIEIGNEYYEKLIQRQDLVDIINAPLD